MGELCDEFLKKRMPIEWMANSRTDIPLEGLLPRMKAAGCWKLFFGIESASERIQTEINKYLSIDVAFSTVSELCRHGLTSTCSFVIGFPTETRAEVGLSICAGARMKIIGAEIVQFHRLRLWPPALLSQQGLPQAFDAVSLSIEYPYLDLPNDDLSEIASDPEFFGGYFSTESSAGDMNQISQLEMFAHHAVSLAPMTVYAIGNISPESLVRAFYEGTDKLGPLRRDSLDWDGGALLKNWDTIMPYIQLLIRTMASAPQECAIVNDILKYERERVYFATEASVLHGIQERSFKLGIDIPKIIAKIKAGERLDEDVLCMTSYRFTYDDTGQYHCYYENIAPMGKNEVDK
jgi:hypothetical protein